MNRYVHGELHPVNVFAVSPVNIKSNPCDFCWFSAMRADICLKFYTSKLESVQLRRHCNSEATPTSRQSIWRIISIFCIFLFENIAFREVPPSNHKYRLAYLMLTRSVMPRDLHSRGMAVAPCAPQCRSRDAILNKQQIRIRFRSQSVLAVTYAVTLTFDPLSLNHVLAITCWNSVLNFSEIDQCTPELWPFKDWKFGGCPPSWISR